MNYGTKWKLILTGLIAQPILAQAQYTPKVSNTSSLLRTAEQPLQKSKTRFLRDSSEPKTMDFREKLKTNQQTSQQIAVRVKREGGVAGGGGNICFLPTGPVLLDLATGSQPIAGRHRNPGIQIPESQMRYSPFNPIKGTLKAQVSYYTANFVSRFPSLGYYLKLGVENTWFYAVEKQFSRPIGADFQDTSACTAQNVRAVIALAHGAKFISRPDWNSLDLETQAALVIHEGWRFAQVALGLEISDLDLQRLTYTTVKQTAELPKSITDQFLNSLFGANDTPEKSCAYLKKISKDKFKSRLNEASTKALVIGCYSPLRLSGKVYDQSFNALYANSTEMSRSLEFSETIDEVLLFYSHQQLKMAVSNFENSTVNYGVIAADMIVSEATALMMSSSPSAKEVEATFDAVMNQFE